MVISREQTEANMRRLRLPGMANAYSGQRQTTSIQELCFDDRLGMLVEAEMIERETRKLKRLTTGAKLKFDACPEDIKYNAKRGMNQELISNILTCDYIENGINIIFTGFTGSGKTWLACALGTQAIRKGYSVLYIRTSRLSQDIEAAYGDGSLPKLRSKIFKKDVLILDDWGLAPLTQTSRQELLEIIDDRLGKKSLIITTQVPVEDWHAWLGEATIADAILDRIVHRAHHIKLKGESMRKQDASEVLNKSDVGGTDHA